MVTSPRVLREPELRIGVLASHEGTSLQAILDACAAGTIAGEVVAVSTGDVEKIGWFVEGVSRFLAAAITVVLVCVGLFVYEPHLGLIVAVGVPVLALGVLPLLPRATRLADVPVAH